MKMELVDKMVENAEKKNGPRNEGKLQRTHRTRERRTVWRHLNSLRLLYSLRVVDTHYSAFTARLLSRSYTQAWYKYSNNYAMIGVKHLRWQLNLMHSFQECHPFLCHNRAASITHNMMPTNGVWASFRNCHHHSLCYSFNSFPFHQRPTRRKKNKFPRANANDYGRVGSQNKSGEKWPCIVSSHFTPFRTPLNRKNTIPQIAIIATHIQRSGWIESWMMRHTSVWYACCTSTQHIKSHVDSTFCSVFLCLTHFK